MALAGTSFAPGALAKGPKARKALAAKPGKNRTTANGLPKASGQSTGNSFSGPYIGLKYVGKI